MFKKEESTPAPQEGNKRVELKIYSTEPKAVRDEVDGIVNNYELGITNYEETPKSPEGTLREEPFEIDISSVARSLGRKIATMIAKGIVQEHYNGDWSKVRFVGLGKESSPLPPSKGEIRAILSDELGAVWQIN